MRGPVAGVNQGDSPQEWYHSLPIVTKIFFTLTLGMTFLSAMGLIPYQYFIYNWQMVRYKFEIWRVVTGCLFAGGFSFNFLMHLYMLYQVSMAYESNAYNTGAGGSSADYLFMSFLGMITLCIIDAFFSLNPLSDAFLYFIMYVRSRRSPDDLMNLWGFKFKALYMPWVYIAFRMLMGASVVSAVGGAVLGHMFYFLVDALPITNGVNLIKTPTLFVDLVAYMSGRPSVSAAPVRQDDSGSGFARRPGAGGTTGYNWGRGRTLGSN